MLKTSKKVLSIVLALVLVFSTTVCAFAAFDASSQILGLVLVPDKDLTKLNEGDTVTFTLYCDVADFSQLFGAYKLMAFFDPNVYEPEAAYTLYNDFLGYYKEASTTTIVTAETTVNNIKKAATNLASEHTAFVNFLGAADTGKGVTAAGGYHMSLDDTIDGNTTRTKAEMSFKMTVKTGANLTTGNTNVVFANAFPNTTYFKTTTGTKATNIPLASMNTELASAMVNNPAAATSILKYSKSQIRFKGITATSGPSTYEGTFDVRTVAKISQADFLATFTSEENAKAKITDFGFVYAAKSNVASFNVDTAKSVAEGATVENYVKAPVTYMQHTGDGADYIFTCLITNIPDADKTDGVNCLAYVCFDGTYIYFDAAESVDYSTLYALMPTA